MNIHEYQAKAVLKEFGVPVSKGVPVFKADEAEAAAKALPGPLWVVKSQIHAGGRGKGKFKEASAGEKGGVRLAKSIDEVKQFSREMLGSTLVTIQTGPAGKQVNRLYIEDGSDIEKEFYLSALVDRATSRVSFVVSTEGGMDIEEVAHSTPEKIKTFLTAKNLSLTVPLDSQGKTAAAYDVQGIPTTIVIGRDGKVAEVFVGAGPDTAQKLEAAVEKALAEK